MDLGPVSAIKAGRHFADEGSGSQDILRRAQLIDRATEAHRLAMSVHWDNATALHRLEGDASLLQELIVIFFEEYPKLSDRLRQAWRAAISRWCARQPTR